MTPFDRKQLLDEISEVETEISLLGKQRDAAEAKLRSLKERLARAASASTRASQRIADSPESVKAGLTSEEKVSLFLRLFRGRDDVFPQLWQNKKTEKIGYSPACANEWVRGVCEKPRIKCMDCPNQAFLPVTPNTVLGHLQGRHVIGIYPMLKDETCALLAADFDKGAWREDVMAFTETCRRLHISYAVERSRSGNGAHVWFFFNSPLPASTARKMASYLITETMARRHQLSMSSYDRLFPNQDTLPSGGFGNLIALPLQYHARKDGNSVFLDESLEPYPDQWRFLASLEPIPTESVEELAAEATARGQVVGIRIPETEVHTIDTTPWLRRPSRTENQISIDEPLPPRVRAALAQRLFIEMDGLPSTVINQVKRLAAFQNPEFYKKQNLRLSTALNNRGSSSPSLLNLANWLYDRPNHCRA